MEHAGTPRCHALSLPNGARAAMATAGDWMGGRACDSCRRAMTHAARATTMGAEGEIAGPELLAVPAIASRRA